LSSGFPLADLIQVKDEETRESIELSKTEWMDLLPSELKENLPQILGVNTSPDNQIFVDESYYETQVTEEENVIVPFMPVGLSSLFNSAEFNLSSETEKVEEENVIVPSMPMDRLGFFTSAERNSSNTDIFKAKRARINIQCD
ncbi:MAG: hypothetical protein QG556_146, partial [Pseudomonadota bacterium]|nr:hypothetical protein [Pseudomonadota bacterium]